jgi:hypothetical protein
VWAIVKEFGRTMGKTIEAISRPSLEALQQHEWPGNIRELRNVIERSMILCQGPTLRVELPAPPGASRAEPPAEDLSLEEVERRHILAVLKRTGWRVSGPRGAAARPQADHLRIADGQAGHPAGAVNSRDFGSFPEISGAGHPGGPSPLRPDGRHKARVHNALLLARASSRAPGTLRASGVRMAPWGPS